MGYLLFIYLKHPNKVFFYYYDNCTIITIVRYNGSRSTFVTGHSVLFVTRFRLGTFRYGQICRLVSKVNHIQYNTTNITRAILLRALELGRYRFLKSVSVFVFLVGFSKVGIGFGIGFSKYRDIGFGFRFFRTNVPLLIE